MLAKPGIKEDLANPMLASLAGHSSGKKTGVEANRGRGTGDRTKFIELRERLHFVGGRCFSCPFNWRAPAVFGLALDKVYVIRHLIKQSLGGL